MAKQRKPVVVIDLDRITVDDLVAVEDRSIRGIRTLFAKMVVDENDEYVDLEEGERVIGGLSLKALFDLAEMLKDQVDTEVPTL